MVRRDSPHAYELETWLVLPPLMFLLSSNLKYKTLPILSSRYSHCLHACLEKLWVLPVLATSCLRLNSRKPQAQLQHKLKMLFPSLTKTYHHDVYHAIDPLRPELSITGKNVLVTGGGEGIGAAFTSTFAAAGAANLIILGRKAETLNAMKSKVEGNTANKTKVHVFPADITDEKRINEVFEEVLRSIGAVDIYIANAGYLPNPGSIIDTSVEEFWRGFEINVKGAIVVAKAFLRSASANPILINITTVAACTRYSGPFGSYSGSKAGEGRLMDTIAVECPHVRVYNVHPGLIETAMAKKSGMTVSPFDSGKALSY